MREFFIVLCQSMWVGYRMSCDYRGCIIEHSIPWYDIIDP